MNDCNHCNAQVFPDCQCLNSGNHSAHLSKLTVQLEIVLRDKQLHVIYSQYWLILTCDSES